VSNTSKGASRHHHQNAGFIRQRPLRLVALPDKFGVPADELFPVCGGVKMRLTSNRRRIFAWLPALPADKVQLPLAEEIE